MCVSCDCCVSLRRADHLSREVQPSVVCLSVIAEPYRGKVHPLGPSSYDKNVFQCAVSEHSGNLSWLVVEHNCVNIGVFIDFVEQLHVSAFIGHRQVVLREVKEFH